ncbi:PaaI family thioesterase [Advenella sp. WQ 585]|uniref:PaaI family thioesterase n=1 Tax=Advenella mandrilli TaxID=2800330 RepID=A0ABS1EDJ9_9BURK|nr:PaaI family thioesterase [Advenella mandrilli]MBK1781716.1 PaaI family thioesterase [Advenella mandrilli]
MEVDDLQLEHFGIEVPFMNHIGLQSISLEGDCCHTHLQLKRDLVNSRGDIHGGALMSALDFTLSVVARAHDLLNVGAATIDMSTHFYEPAKSNIDIIATCKRRGKSIAFCEGEVQDENGVVLAAARAVFKLVPRTQ